MLIEIEKHEDELDAYKGKWRNVYQGPERVTGEPITIYGDIVSTREEAESLRAEVLAAEFSWIPLTYDPLGLVGINCEEITFSCTMPVGDK